MGRCGHGENAAALPISATTDGPAELTRPAAAAQQERGAPDDRSVNAGLTFYFCNLRRAVGGEQRLGWAGGRHSPPWHSDDVKGSLGQRRQRRFFVSGSGAADETAPLSAAATCARR